MPCKCAHEIFFLQQLNLLRINCNEMLRRQQIVARLVQTAVLAVDEHVFTSTKSDEDEARLRRSERFLDCKPHKVHH